MKYLVLFLAAGLAVVGCRDHSEGHHQTADKEEASIKDNLAKLSPEDQKLAAEQRWCAVDPENRLGSMGKPFKVMVKDQPVFLCCEGCKKQALKEEDKTLAAVRDLKAKAAQTPK
jgi:hypothetical protein